MYTDVPEFPFISPAGLMVNALHNSAYMTKEGSCEKMLAVVATWLEQK